MMHSTLRNGSCLCARRKGQGKDDHGQNWVRLTNQLKRENDFERLNLTVFKTDIRPTPWTGLGTKKKVLLNYNLNVNNLLLLLDMGLTRLTTDYNFLK